MSDSLTNLAIERAVLSSFAQYGDEFYVEYKDLLDSSCFTHELNQVLFGCLEDIIKTNKKIEFITILESAEKLGLYELMSKDSEIKFIRSLFNMPVSKDNLGQFVSKLAKLKFARDIKNAVSSCTKKIDKITGDEELNDIIAIVEDPINDIINQAYKEHCNATQPVGENINDYVQYLADNPVDYLGIPSGMERFDEATGGGFRRKSICLIAARTGIGKSVIATNVGLHVAGRKKIPALYLDTEMDLGDQRNRILSNLSGVEINQIAKGKFNRSIMERSRVLEAAKLIESIPFHYISIAGQPFDNILNIAKRWIKQHVGVDESGRTKDCLIIYDYFKLMSSSGLSAAMQEYQALGFQITKMHDFCVTNDVPCLSFVQLNRENEVAQSDRLLWLATTVAKFEPKSADEIADDGEENGNRKLTIIKARHGSGLEYGDYINLRMAGKYAKLKELHTRNELKAGIIPNEEDASFESEPNLFSLQSTQRQDF